MESSEGASAGYGTRAEERKWPSRGDDGGRCSRLSVQTLPVWRIPSLEDIGRARTNCSLKLWRLARTELVVRATPGACCSRGLIEVKIYQLSCVPTFDRIKSTGYPPANPSYCMGCS